MKHSIPGIFSKRLFSGSLLVLCLTWLLALGAMFALGMLAGQLIRREILNLPAQSRRPVVLPKLPLPEDPEIEKEAFVLVLEQNVFDAKRRELPAETRPLPPPEERVIQEGESQSAKVIQVEKIAAKEKEEEKTPPREIVKAPPPMPAPFTEPISEGSINQLELELRGTIVAKYPQSSYSFIAKKNEKNEKILATGDCFSLMDLKKNRDCPPDSLKLIKVMNRKVALLKDGMEEWLIMEEPGATITELTRAEEKKQIPEPVLQAKTESRASPLKTNPKPQLKPKPKSKPESDVKKVVILPESNRISGAPISADQETFHLQREWVDEQLSDFAKILQDARVVPVTIDQQTFFQFKFIKKGSMYEVLGLKKNDIILSINETMIDNVTKAMGLLQKLQSEREIALMVKREESEKILRYYIN